MLKRNKKKLQDKIDKVTDKMTQHVSDINDYVGKKIKELDAQNNLRVHSLRIERDNAREEILSIKSEIDKLKTEARNMVKEITSFVNSGPKPENLEKARIVLNKLFQLLK